MKYPASRPPSGRRRAGPPPPGRRSSPLWHLLAPRSSRTLVLGVIMSFSGLVGGVRGLLDEAEIRPFLAAFGIGILGLALTVSWVVTYVREH
ncbi:hypothetical protein G3I50_11270 [Streptomyces parvus]|uniref:Uncharacterized protein n=1 Tax=Streptomyces parvus TaxID=66428 RepID=A0A7K3RUW9_9ACTN|nr:hypothetical protein [Streptomyces parvus]